MEPINLISQIVVMGLAILVMQNKFLQKKKAKIPVKVKKNQGN